MFRNFHFSLQQLQNPFIKLPTANLLFIPLQLRSSLPAYLRINLIKYIMQMKIHNILNNYHLVDAKNTNDSPTREKGEVIRVSGAKSVKHLSSFPAVARGAEIYCFAKSC
jgi:hypothetical protein